MMIMKVIQIIYSINTKIFISNHKNQRIQNIIQLIAEQQFIFQFLFTLNDPIYQSIVSIKQINCDLVSENNFQASIYKLTNFSTDSAQKMKLYQLQGLVRESYQQISQVLILKQEYELLFQLNNIISNINSFTEYLKLLDDIKSMNNEKLIQMQCIFVQLVLIHFYSNLGYNYLFLQILIIKIYFRPSALKQLEKQYWHNLKPFNSINNIQKHMIKFLIVYLLVIANQSLLNNYYLILIPLFLFHNLHINVTFIIQYSKIINQQEYILQFLIFLFIQSNNFFLLLIPSQIPLEIFIQINDNSYKNLSIMVLKYRVFCFITAYLIHKVLKSGEN
ncbi:hypothetical protein pb186bvf_020506 [Paramecium bursaria]